MNDAEALDLAKRAASIGGRLALARMGDPGFLTWKGHRDVVSGATLDVQTAIVAALRAECANDGILAEEGPEDEPLATDADRLWIVDPICGSLNFVHGIPFFGVSIALRVAGRLRVGVVYDPMHDEVFSARVDEPAYLNDRPIQVLATPLGPEFWEQAWIGTDLPHTGPVREVALQIFQLLGEQVLTQVVLGSPALGLCYVAAGRLHAYWNIDARPWDVAAACVILQQAGAIVSDADGGPWVHSEGSYLAATPASHQWAMRGLKLVRERARSTGLV